MPEPKKKPKVKVPKPKAKVPPPDEDIIAPHELNAWVNSALRYGSFYRLLSEMNNYFDISLGGYVTRDRGGNYVHERTTTFEFRGDPTDWQTKDFQPLAESDVQRIFNLMSAVEKIISEQIVEINQAIYKSLSAEYDYIVSDEQIIDGIEGNDYKFDEDGTRNDEGSFEYKNLDDAAQEKVRDWYREGMFDHEWWEGVYDMWKERLEEMGFSNDIEIRFSGFSSQGDGASFTCDVFDFAKYAAYLSANKAKDIGL